MDIYSRVRELVEDKKEALTMEQIFTSSEYARFIWNKTVNIISGAFYSLRRHGFNVSQNEENKLLPKSANRNFLQSERWAYCLCWSR